MSASQGEAVTLAVTPREAELLAFAERRGRLKIVVRAVGDAEQTQTRTVNFSALLKGASTPPPPKTPPPQTSTQIIQGVDSDR